MQFFLSRHFRSFLPMLTIIAPSPDHKRIYRVSSLAPGAVHRAVEVLSLVSGKGVNAARALRCVGAAVKLVTPAGQAFHDALLEDASMEGVQLEVLRVAHPTRSCVTLLSEDGTATEIVQEAAPFSEEEASAFLAKSSEVVDHADGLLLAGSLPAGLDPGIYEQCATRATRRGIPVVVDAHGVALLSAVNGGVDVVKITRSELLDTVKLVQEAHDVPGACSVLRDSGARAIVVTDGAGPVTVVEENGTIWSLVPEPVAVVNPVGSGDAMSAGVALALSKGQSLRDAVMFGMRMGAANAATLFPGQLTAEFTEMMRAEQTVRPANRTNGPSRTLR